jgi:hypothetical protein
MDMLKIARESGLAIVLDAKIGSEEYTSVSGSTSALLRFGEAVRSASLRVHRRFRRSSSLCDRIMIARKKHAGGLPMNVARKIKRPPNAVSRKLAALARWRFSVYQMPAIQRRAGRSSSLTVNAQLRSHPHAGATLRTRSPFRRTALQSYRDEP